MIAYILTAVFLSLLWAAVLAYNQPVEIAIAPTVAVVLTVAALILIRKLKDKKAARELEKALVAQGDAQLKSAAPDQSPEIQAMQDEFTKAVGALKSSKLARGGSDALSVLPWYVIIGPPGSGKTTALLKSGLHFPYLSASGEGVRGVGGTRNCHWWMTNEAVILDTAGRYTTADDDRDEWFSFLDTLSRHRKKPLNGLIAACSVQDLLEGDEESAAALGRKIRERIDEVMSRLKVILPVYVVLTKCDLVSGFVETFGSLPKGERGQIWGFTVPMDKKLASPGDLFRERFDELVTVLEKRSLRRLADERRQQTREKVYQFPLQFGALKKNLSELVQNLFVENVYQDTPVLRGVYFTSGTQEGRPIDRMMRAIAEGFGIRRSWSDGAEQVVEAKSYFLTEVFQQVMFKDQALAVRSTAENKRQQVLRYVYAGVGLALALLVLLFPTLSFFNNRALAKASKDAISGVKLEKAVVADAAWLAKLDPVKKQLEELLAYEKDGPPVSMQFGMYQGGKLKAELARFYATALNKAVVAPLLAHDVELMDAWARAHEGSDGAEVGPEHVALYDKLKLHLLLSSPRAEGEPQIGEAESQWIASQLASRWSELATEGSPGEAAAAVEAHLNLYGRLASDPSLLVQRNEPVVRRIRTALALLPWEKFALEKVIAEVSGELPDLTLKGVMGGAATWLKGTRPVRSAFTRKGWETLIQPRLSGQQENSEGWVLGEAARKGKAADAETRALKSAYFEAYIQEWKDFLKDIRIDAPSNNREAHAMLEDLTRGKTPPYPRLFQLVASQVRLVPPEKAAGLDKLTTGLANKVKIKGKGAGDLFNAASKAAAKKKGQSDDEKVELTARDVEPEFEGFISFGVALKAAEGGSDEVPLDIYQAQLELLRDSLRDFMDSKDDTAPLRAKLQQASARVKSLLSAHDVRWAPRLEALLWPPILAASRSSTCEASLAASQNWKVAVATPFNESLANVYPFNPSSRQEAPVSDVAEFFKPESGTLWGYYGATLKNDVVMEGSSFKWSGRFEGASKEIYSDGLLKYLERSREITTALFPKGAKEPTTRFTAVIRPAPKAASIRFSVDGDMAEYKMGPDLRHTFVWPGEGKEKGARLEVRTSSGNAVVEQAGEWGLYRVLEQAQIDPPSGGGRTFTAKWKLPTVGTEVAIVFEVAKDSPFFGTLRPGERPELLKPFRGPLAKAPAAVGKGGGSCEGLVNR